MRYHVLACDYDGTLAHEGKVAEETLAFLERLLATGRRLIMVTGRELHDLLNTFPDIGLFHRVVAENGALLYDPATKEEKALGAPLPEGFVRSLQQHGAEVSFGRVIISTLRPYENAVLAAIHDTGLELQTIFNRDAVMILPAGVNKATGLAAALDALDLSPHEVAGVGDAENDHAFLTLCEFSVAVANAIPTLKETADWVTAGEEGAGVGELIEELIANDLETYEARSTRRRLLLGSRNDGSDVWLSPRGPSILIAGPSGSGKSTVATAFIERLSDARYQFCIIDPEGDYEGLPGAVTLGRGGRAPMAEEVMEVLARPDHNVVVNLLGLPVTERPPFFLELLPRLQEMRAHTGRPHWLLLDEAHHLLPALWELNQSAAVGDLKRTVFITVHPDQVLPSALGDVGIVLAVGKDPQETLDLAGKSLQKSPPPRLDSIEPETAILWPASHGGDSYPVRIAPSQIVHQRHIRKYAIGELPPDRSFYFRGPGEKLNLRAQNLQMFLQLADGVDAETWLYHLRKGDYSAWFRDCIKDDQLAGAAESLEQQNSVSADESRRAIRDLVERLYVLSVPPPLPMPGTDAAPVRQG